MSNSIYIAHNPFTIETEFMVNGETPDNISFFENIREQRLQRWVEQFFPMLHNIFNGDDRFDVIFKGVEADYLDLLEAAEVAKKQGMSINIDWEQTESSESRLKKIQHLMDEAEKHPIFADKIHSSKGELQKNLKIAFNKDFDVYVAATMSAGKSTLINAMLGCDLLPAANQATTATIAQITDNDKMDIGHFEGSRFNKEGEEIDGLQIVTLDMLKEWNSKPDTKLIKLTGNIQGIKERESVRLVLTDTPGPNNSQDPEHNRITMSYIQDSQRNPLILYLLNATQLATYDDQNVLGEISKIMQQGGKQAKDRFIFVVNKMDQFDPEKEGSIEQALEEVKKYLIKNGIDNPQIYPVSAHLAHLLRKKNSTPNSMTRKEKSDLAAMECVFTEQSAMNLTKYMPLTSSVRRSLERKNLPTVLAHSGLPAIESMIDEYIDKYNFPNRVNRAYQALRKIIKIAGEESQLQADLASYVNELKIIEEQINLLKNSKDISAKAKAKIEAIITPAKLMPRDALARFDKEEANIRALINEFQNKFLGNNIEFTKTQATKRINKLTNDISFQANILINSLEGILEEGQNIAQQNLTVAFNEYVKDLFTDLDLPMPIVDGLKHRISSLASFTNLGLEDDEVEVRVSTERVKTGTKTVSYKQKVGERSTSTWWKPWTWGDTENIYETRYREEDVYENREKQEEVVNAEELWENRESQILQYFNILMNTARDKLESDVLTFANSFRDFMEKEFQIKFEEILNDLTQKLKDRDNVIAQAKEAHAKLEQIKQFSDKLDDVLKL
ncbi:dynamin family protein [Pasteurella sp. PK-2025]|uniref:dynamin family protein n=1 Tax=Pasteurella sp. PK-2025 TaxID=3413133 RepID=UPI003C783208